MKKPSNRPFKKLIKKTSSPFKKFVFFCTRWLVITCTVFFKVALLLPIPIFLLWYSYTIDRNGWFQGEQYEREIAIAMLDGNPISNFEKMQEREIVKLYAQNLSHPLQAISIGSSRVLQLTNIIAGTTNFFNAGMIGAEQPDVMSSYYLFDRAEKIPEVVIFGVDPWIFSSAPEATTYRRVDKKMYNEFLYYGLGYPVEITTEEENMNFWLSLTSPAFFQENLKYYIQNKETGMRPQIVQGDLYQQPNDVKLPDGSVLYSNEIRNTSSEDVDHIALTAINNSFVNCEGFTQMDPNLMHLFDQFINYMQQKGSQVVLLLTPYHPIVYQKVLEQPDRYSGFWQVESWLKEYALSKGLALYGSYDPKAVNCTNSDFFDGWHIKGEGISKFFPGIQNLVPYAQMQDSVTPHRVP